jgi:uncharacterized protein YacL
MNINRLIWMTTTVLFCIVGAMLGWYLGTYYAAMEIKGGGGSIAGKPIGVAVVTAITGGVAIVMARIGSWLANRFMIGGLRRLQQLSAADRVLGIIGFLLGALFGLMVALTLPNDPWYMLLPVKLCLMAVTAVIGMALLQGMQSEMLRVFPQLQGDAEDNEQIPGMVKLLDTNIIIDGRMAELCKTGFVEGIMYVPTFVLDEVQHIADSSDSMRRARGRRGLDVLNAMQNIGSASAQGTSSLTSHHALPVVQVLTDIPESVERIEAVDSKLVALAKEMSAAIVTNDFNLNRVAELHGVRVLNINELAQALKPVVLPGEEMNLTIVKEGKEPGQGVGYLEDGTMVVVGDGGSHIGETCKVTISSVYQTVAGKMIFADMKGMKGSGEDLFDDNSNRDGAIGRDTAGRDNNARRHAGSNDDNGNRSGGGMRRKGRS